MSLCRYTKYKASGVAWLGEIPSHWDCCALKRVAGLQSGDAIDSESIDESGTYPVFGGNGLRGYTASCTHDGDYVLIGRQGALCGNINYASGRFWASEHAVVVTPLRPLETRWLGELLRAMNLNQYSISAAQPGLSVEMVGNLRIPLPPKNDQLAISVFLDRETAKINALIAEQQSLIGLLKEKRQSVICQAVTKGLHRNASMVDSGIPWWGDVPKHWTLSPLKRAFDAIDYGISDSLESAGAIAVLRMGNISGGKVILEDLKYVDAVEPSLLLRSGDLLYNRTNSLDLIGKVGLYLGDSEVPISFASYLVRLRTRASCEPNYFAYLLNTPGVLGEARSNAIVAIGQCNLNPTRYGALIVAIPPRTEQLEIARFLDRETANLDALTGEAERAIALLEERRSALISAAVTGQIDVRDLIAARPETEVAA